MDENDLIIKLEQSIRLKREYIVIIKELIAEEDAKKQILRDEIGRHYNELLRYEEEIRNEQILIDKIKNFCTNCKNANHCKNANG